LPRLLSSRCKGDQADPRRRPICSTATTTSVVEQSGVPYPATDARRCWHGLDLGHSAIEEDVVRRKASLNLHLTAFGEPCDPTEKSCRAPVDPIAMGSLAHRSAAVTGSLSQAATLSGARSGSTSTCQHHAKVRRAIRHGNLRARADAAANSGSSPPSASSTHRLAPLPRLRRRRSPREPHRFLIQKHHHDLRTGARFVRGHDVVKTAAVIVAGDVVPARRPDVRPVDLEVPGAKACGPRPSRNSSTKDDASSRLPEC
jgi:hypothetical protein